MTNTEIAIIGAGTAGLTAAIYCARAGKNVIVFEKGVTGGRITEAEKVENYPGISTITGSELGQIMANQAKSLSAKIVSEEVTGIYPEENIVKTPYESYRCKAVIISAGLKNRMPNAKNAKKFLGRGLSFCALCDGGFFKGKDVCVLGGGNTALSEALYLSELCSRVCIIHRRNTFRAEDYLVKKVSKTVNISFIMETEIIEFVGENSLTGINVKSGGDEKFIKTDGVFSALGYVPNADLYKHLVPTDKDGFALCDENCRSNYNSIFIAGDCRRKDVRQIITACSDGAVAAHHACADIENSNP